MKFNWVQFVWDLSQLPASLAPLPQHYSIENAQPGNAHEIRLVVLRSLRLDPVWNPALHEVVQMVNGWLDRAFAVETRHLCLALRHGARVIGASVLSLDSSAGQQFEPGPCILNEYRNRGFGSHLLAHSLHELRSAGLDRATATTRERTPAARFLYSKFNSVATAVNRVPLLAA